VNTVLPSKYANSPPVVLPATPEDFAKADAHLAFARTFSDGLISVTPRLAGVAIPHLRGPRAHCCGPRAELRFLRGHTARAADPAWAESAPTKMCALAAVTWDPDTACRYALLVSPAYRDDKLTQKIEAAKAALPLYGDRIASPAAIAAADQAMRERYTAFDWCVVRGKARLHACLCAALALCCRVLLLPLTLSLLLLHRSRRTMHHRKMCPLCLHACGVHGCCNPLHVGFGSSELDYMHRMLHGACPQA
jgi:hypothetical protein